MLGGAGMARPLDKREKAIVKAEKNKVETYLGTTFTVYDPVLIKIQVVNGENFVVKILVDNEEYIHVKMNVPFEYTGKEDSPEPASLIYVHTGKTFDDKL